MTTSRPILFLSEVVDGIAEGKPIPLSTLAYFRERLLNRFHSLLIQEYLRQNRLRKFTQTDFARRIGRKPEQINRWLAAGGNWTIETISDLFLALGAELGPVEDLEVAFLEDRLWPKAKTAGAGVDAILASQLREMNSGQQRSGVADRPTIIVPTGRGMSSGMRPQA
jgi:hypothetical protein